MYLISYDISSDRLRNKVAKTMEEYGRRVQYSVFECTLSEKQYRDLRIKLTTLLTDSEKAGIRIYRICKNCEDQITTIGVSPLEYDSAKEDLIII